jgi:hypothetical protein
LHTPTSNRLRTPVARASAACVRSAGTPKVRRVSFPEPVGKRPNVGRRSTGIVMSPLRTS